MAELLAPVGSYDALNAAIFSGADAVYLGLSKFNARQKAENFNESNIKQVIDLCHLNGVKVYITFNTLIKDVELDDFKEQVRICAEANADAFIITDLGTLDIFRQYDIPMHASTQMGIHNYEGAKLAKELGFTRVVLSREALEKDIVEIKKLGLEIEFFVHGALCVSFSGGCLLSSFMSGDSGNRGLCKQPCRLRYKSSITNKEKYYLSTSDQCLITKLQWLENLGVDSFKIEGRLKAAHYVGEVVRQYRAAMTNKAIKSDAMMQLRKAYNRGGFTTGYNFDKTQDIMSTQVQGNQGEYIGHIVTSKGKSLNIYSTRPIRIGDGVKVFDGDVEIGGFKIDNVKKEGKLYVVNTLKRYPDGAKLYLTLDSEMVDEYTDLDLALPVDVYFKAKIGMPLEIVATSNNISYELKLDNVDAASSRPITKDDVLSKLSEIGETGFYLLSIDGEIDNNAFYPMSKLKAAKRDLISGLREKILNNYNEQKIRIVHKNPNINNLKYEGLKSIICEISDINAMTDYMISKCTVILNLSNFATIDPEYIIKNCLIYNNIEKICLKIPKILRYEDMCIIKKFIKANIDGISGLYIDNIGGVELANEFSLPYIAGFGINIFNSNAPKNINICNYVYSVELSKADLTNFNGDGYIYAYGPLSLMTLSHCPVQENTNCSCLNCAYSKEFSYSNNFISYQVKRTKIAHCYFDLYNPKIIDLRSEINSIGKKLYINLSDMKASDIQVVLSSFVSRNGKPSENSTLGHFTLAVK